MIPINRIGIQDSDSSSRPDSIGERAGAMHRANAARCPDIALTKRRAVDFCRVATAICPAG